MGCRCDSVERFDDTHRATDYMREHLEPMRVIPDEADSVLDVRTGGAVEVTSGGAIMRCRACEARWREQHVFDPRGSLVRTLEQLPRSSRSDYLDHRWILRRAEQLAAAQHAVWRARETFERTGDVQDSTRLEEALAAFARARGAFYTVDLAEIVDALRDGDPSVVEHAVVVLEADPWCARSGYLKADLMRYLARMDVPEPMKHRLRRVVVTVVARGARRELRHTRKLARALRSPRLVERLREQRYDEQAGAQATWVLETLEAG